MTKDLRWLSLQRYFLQCALCALLVFTAMRLAMLFWYSSEEISGEDWSALSNDLLAGFRLDLKTVAALWLVAWFVSLPVLVGRLVTFCKALLFFWSVLALALAWLFSIINFFYYEAFQSYLDERLFKFADAHNRREVMKSLALDWRLSWLVLGFVLVLAAQAWAFWLLWRRALARVSGGAAARLWNARQAARWVLVLALFFALALIFRGSLTARPYTLQRAVLSSNQFFNVLIPNGLWAFYEAAKKESRAHLLFDVSDERARLALRLLDGPNAPRLPRDRPLELRDWQTMTTLTREMPRLPHVVVAVMENFGAKALDFHRPDNDMLGRLAAHFQADYVFPNFISGASGTVLALSKIMFPHPFAAQITDSALAKTRFFGAFGDLFQRKGYRTAFVYAGRKQASNMGRFYPLQGLSQVYDQYDIVSGVPNARYARAWGAYDHDAFEFMLGLLKESSEPLLLVFLSMSNHMPFEPPKAYRPKPIAIDVLDLPVALDRTLARRIVETYQYANDALGGFIDRIKDDPYLAQNTIVAATGDHALRYLVDYRSSKAHPADAHRVPFYLYLPKQHRRNMREDTSRFGAHRDIFPTIINRIFAKTPYLKSGDDLLAMNIEPKHEMAFSLSALFDRHGAVLDYQSVAPRYYQWQRQSAAEQGEFWLQAFELLEKPSGALERLQARGRAYWTLQHWYAGKQIEPELLPRQSLNER